MPTLWTVFRCWAIAESKPREQKDTTIVTTAIPLSLIKWVELGKAGG